MLYISSLSHLRLAVTETNWECIACTLLHASFYCFHGLMITSLLLLYCNIVQVVWLSLIFMKLWSVYEIRWPIDLAECIVLSRLAFTQLCSVSCVMNWSISNFFTMFIPVSGYIAGTFLHASFYCFSWSLRSYCCFTVISFKARWPSLTRSNPQVQPCTK